MKALITFLILGTTSLAAANPGPRDARYSQVQYSDRYDRAHWYRDGRPDRMRWRRPVLLAQNVQMIARHHRDDRPVRVNLDPRVGSLDKLRLDHEAGQMFVRSIVVTYADGSRQTFRVNRSLSPRDRSIVIDVRRGSVTGVYVYGQTTRGRSATFDVIGLRR